jgi:hypothetical protein
MPILKTEGSMINKERTKNLPAPVCPYCEETLKGHISFVYERKNEPDFQYMYCPECHALLAIMPIPPKVPYDVEGTKEIVSIGRDRP